jgi:DNA invertase Pin-like site-specific DNA recombinase
MLKVAAYCRVSTDAEDQVNSLQSQKSYFNDYIRGNKDWKLVDVYADEGISGTQAKKRPAFMRMMRDAQDKKIDLILTKEISRFARNTLDSLQYTRQLKSMGIGVTFINDNINTLDADAELRLTIMSSIAQEEVRKTSDRVKWGQKRRMEKGVVFGNGVYGFHLHSGQLSINEEEAKVVRLIFHKFLTEGKGTHIIARELREEGYPSKKKKEWSSVNILNIIRNEKYCGDLLQKKEYTPDYLDHRKIKNANAEEKVYLRDHHDAIVDRDTWEKAQAELARRSPSKEVVARYSNRYWCSGKIKCGICGSKYIQKTNQRKYGVYRYLVCHSQSRHGSPKIDQCGNQIGCDNSTVNYKTLLFCMEYAINFVAQSSESIIIDVMDTIRQAQAVYQHIDTTALERKITALKEKKDMVIELYAEGVMEKDEIRPAVDKYSKEIEAIEKQLSQHNNGLHTLQEQADAIQSALESFTTLEHSEDTYKRLLERLTVYKDHIELKFNDIPFCVEIQYETKGVKTWYETIVTNCGIRWPNASES